jgi:hypothetical protein
VGIRRRPARMGWGFRMPLSETLTAQWCNARGCDAD